MKRDELRRLLLTRRGFAAALLRAAGLLAIPAGAAGPGRRRTLSGHSRARLSERAHGPLL
jgi:hypothetical protein